LGTCLNHGLVGGAGLSDDGHVVFGLDEGGDAGAKDCVVVDSEDADHRNRSPSPRDGGASHDRSASSACQCRQLTDCEPAGWLLRSSASCIAPAAAFRDAVRVAKRCLIVDDNADFLASASRLLKSQGLEVVGCVSSGEEALKLAEKHRPDVVL